MSRYDAAFSHLGNYTLPIDYVSGTLFHEGLAWKGNLLFSMVHEGTTPILAEVFLWDPDSETFSLVQRLRPPTDECTQGLALAADARTMWWAERFHGGSPTQDHRIVQSTLHEVRVPSGSARLRSKSAQATSLFGWFPLNDNSGAAGEVLAGLYNGVLADGASWLTEPARGPCVAFDGADGKVTIPAALLNSALADVTVSGWFLADEIPGSSMLINGNAAGANAGDWQINIESNSAIRFAYNSTGTTLVTLDTAADTVRPGEWFHVAAVLKSGGSGYAKIYVNGEEAATSGTTGVLGGNSQEIRIGLQSNDTSPLFGKAHDVRFYDAALEPEVIAAMCEPATMFDLWR